MRRAIKVAAWTAAFLTSAGVGAYIAANTDPFPPGVDRPGVSAAPTTPTSSPAPKPVRWVGSLRSFTYHELYVGGRCITRWRGTLRFTVDGAGRIAGTGAARLDGGLECDFPIAQTQVRRVGLEITGRVRDGRLTIRLMQTFIEPSSGQDFGAFGAFLPVRVSVPLRQDAAEGRIVRRRVDEQGRGTYFWSTTFKLRTL